MKFLKIFGKRVVKYSKLVEEMEERKSETRRLTTFSEPLSIQQHYLKEIMRRPAVQPEDIEKDVRSLCVLLDQIFMENMKDAGLY